MTRSPFTVNTSLAVICPKCGAPPGGRCKRHGFVFLKRCHSARRKAADDKRTREVQGQAKPLFTRSTEPIQPEYYHNAPGRDGIFVTPYQTEREPWPPNHDRPSYLPMREPFPPRAEDPNPDDTQRKCFGCGKQECARAGACNRYPF